MHTNRSVAPRTATTDVNRVRREGRTGRSRLAGLVAAGAVIGAGALAACTSPGASGGVSVPTPLSSLNASALASMASAAASVAGQAALGALDQVNTAITANQSSGNLSADDANSLTQLTAALKSALQTGDTSGAKTALDNLSSKVDSFASKLNGDAGTQLKSAIAALKAAMPTS